MLMIMTLGAILPEPCGSGGETQVFPPIPGAYVVSAVTPRRRLRASRIATEARILVVFRE